MKVLFIRHGEAEERTFQSLDEDRSLTIKGRADLDEAMVFIRRALQNQQVKVASSSLLRARQTAEYLTDKYELCEFMATGNLQQLRAYVEANQQLDYLVLVGHEPFISLWIHDLTRQRIKVKKGMLIELVWPNQLAQQIKLKDYSSFKVD